MSDGTTVELMNSQSADEFRELLDTAGLTQYALASDAHLGMSLNATNRWATGRAPFPNYARAYLKLYIKYKESLRHSRKLRLIEEDG